MKPILHLIPNSHLDPVWLWTWKEGAAEVIATVRTILDLMEDEPELTYIRGEAWTYEVLEKQAPQLLDRIAPLVEAGRWDIVGGNYIQPDTNLPHTEALLRQFWVGQEYFQRRFGRKATVAWAADSFGHAAGWPEIYAAAGLRRFAFSRPGESLLTLPGGEPGFRWRGAGGSELLCHRLPIGWYGNERHDLTKRLDEALDTVRKKAWMDLPVYFGLGDHGGGPTRRHLREIAEWRRLHPEIEVRYSHLTGFFDAWEKAIASGAAPRPKTFTGELNYCNRGCYASGARVKFAYRKAENAVLRSERIVAATGAAADELKPLWASLLFNAFHDILPGSSIEEACDEHQRELDGLRHRAEALEAGALAHLGQKIDTRVPVPPADFPTAVPHLVFNPQPYRRKSWIEIESSLDYRPLPSWRNQPERVPVTVRDGRGRALRYQKVEVAHNFIRHVPWRVRLLVEVDLPAMGWTLVQIGLGKRAKKPGKKRVRWGGNTLRFGKFVIAAKAGTAELRVGGEGMDAALGVACFDDPWGSWGDHYGEKEAIRLKKILRHWKLREVRLVEAGPYRTRLWTSWSGTGGELELTLSLVEDDPAIHIDGRLLFSHRRGRIKLLLGSPAVDHAEFEVPGARIVRGIEGEVPGGRWVRTLAGKRPVFVFASDSCYGFDLEKGRLGVTLVRASRYAADQPQDKEDQPWHPAIDRGFYRFAFRLGPGAIDPDRLADTLEMPAPVQMTDPHPGDLPPSHSLFEARGPKLRLLALQPLQEGVTARLQSFGPVRNEIILHWNGKAIRPGKIIPGKILSVALGRPA